MLSIHVRVSHPHVTLRGGVRQDWKLKARLRQLALTLLHDLAESSACKAGWCQCVSVAKLTSVSSSGSSVTVLMICQQGVMPVPPAIKLMRLCMHGRQQLSVMKFSLKVEVCPPTRNRCCLLAWPLNPKPGSATQTGATGHLLAVTVEPCSTASEKASLDELPATLCKQVAHL